MKKRFTESAWFPFLTVLILAIGTVGAYALLKPTGGDISNYEILKAGKIVGWVVGPAIALLTLILIGLLNVIRRIVRLRKVSLLHAPTVFVALLPAFSLAWMLTAEPRLTPIARMLIDFAGRPLLWGSLSAMIFVILCGLLSLKKPKA